MKFFGEVDLAQRPIDQSLVAIRILSWILNHFQDSLPLADKAQTAVYLSKLWTGFDKMFWRCRREAWLAQWLID